MNIYVGNLSFETSEEDIRKAFEAHGDVESVRLISDKITGKSKGFGFIEMNDKKEAIKAINSLNETELNGRALKVNEARPREDRNTGRSGRGSHNFY